MTQFSDRSGFGADGTGPRQRLVTPADDSVNFRVFFSEDYPDAPDRIQQRLEQALDGTGICLGVSRAQILLIHMRRLIRPSEWTRILDWLLDQPEVTFAVRTRPLTILQEDE